MLNWKKKAGFIKIEQLKKTEIKKEGIDFDSIDWIPCSWSKIKEDFGVRLFRKRNGQSFIYTMAEEKPSVAWTECMNAPMAIDFSYGKTKENNKIVNIGKMYVNGHYSYIIKE